ncbi:hypothetical protein [Alloyangia pacifica]|uniref:hypothetical protein n=1 Tax=Alloyangia pacifica TaxID=311180 RepID=UPI0031CFE10A
MLEFTEFLNAIEPEAWAGIVAFVGGVGAAFIAAMRGVKRTPIEVGHPAPETDRTEYVLEEARGNRAILKEVIGRLDRIENDTEALRRDTAVLLARHD